MTENTLSSEEQKAKDEDLRKRVESFNADLIPLLGNYKVGLGAQVFVTTDGRIGARPTVFDDSKSEAEVPTASVVEPEQKTDTGLAAA